MNYRPEIFQEKCFKTGLLAYNLYEQNFNYLINHSAQLVYFHHKKYNNLNFYSISFEKHKVYYKLYKWVKCLNKLFYRQ